MNKVSIIIPVYNVEKYITECLESVIKQTYQHLEIICINDGSTDKSQKILNQFAASDKRIIIINQENQGQGVARNVGLQRATGKYISFVDADDFIHPQFIEILINLIIKTGSDVAMCRVSKVKDISEADFKDIDCCRLKCEITENPLSTILSHKKFRVRFTVCPCLYKADLIKHHKFIRGIFYEDYPWVIELMSKSPRVVISTEKTYCYRYNPNSTTKSRFTVKKVQDYHMGLNYLYNLFYNKEDLMNFLCKRIVPNILKTQLQLIDNTSNNQDLRKEFGYELSWLKAHDLLLWKYNRWDRMWRYWGMIKNYNKN